MTYIGQFLKITFIFTVDGQDEVADTSINMAAGGAWTGALAGLTALDDSDIQSFADSYVPMMTVTGGRWADYSNLNSIKVAAIGTDGLYLGDPKETAPGSTMAGTVIGNPIQCTQVVSTRAATNVGKGKWGRMYLPHFYMSVLTDNPHTDSTQAAALAEAAATFLDEVSVTCSAAVGSAVHPYIMGQTGVGTKNQITRVRVGNVIDTQRRRREQLVETYFENSLA